MKKLQGELSDPVSVPLKFHKMTPLIIYKHCHIRYVWTNSDVKQTFVNLRIFTKHQSYSHASRLLFLFIYKGFHASLCVIYF